MVLAAMAAANKPKPMGGIPLEEEEATMSDVEIMESESHILFKRNAGYKLDGRGLRVATSIDSTSVRNYNRYARSVSSRSSPKILRDHQGQLVGKPAGWCSRPHLAASTQHDYVDPRNVRSIHRDDAEYRFTHLTGP